MQMSILQARNSFRRDGSVRVPGRRSMQTGQVLNLVFVACDTPTTQARGKRRADVRSAGIYRARTVEGVPPTKNPMVGSLAACCARAVSGHAVAAPPRSVMNVRRLTRS